MERALSAGWEIEQTREIDPERTAEAIEESTEGRPDLAVLFEK